VFNAEHRDGARERLTHILTRLEPVAPKVCALLEEAEEDLIAFYTFPSEHWTKLRSTNPLERVNKEIGRRSDVVGLFPNDASVIRLAGALLIEQNDEWLVQRPLPLRRIDDPDARRYPERGKPTYSLLILRLARSYVAVTADARR
jgi:transposase-like protein